LLVAASFVTAKIWKQPRCPSEDMWVKNLINTDDGTLFSTNNKPASKQWRQKKSLNTYYPVEEANLNALLSDY
jgi:hypothetical protein